MEKFCTCKKKDCNLHPINHDYGCDLCIKKNLKFKEIPSCFFHLVKDDLSDLSDFSIESFAREVLSNKV